MYGIVNKAIEELVVHHFGEEKWRLIKERSGVDVEFFISNEPYDDRITYQLAEAVSLEMNMPITAVLEAFGEWWILHTGREQYGYLLESGGDNLKKFLLHLPLFHNRVMMIYPKLTAPEFKISDVNERDLLVHYFSERAGLQHFVVGLLTGLGKFYNCPVQVEMMQSRDSGADHEIFKVTW